jgi:hypothetical protein
MAVVHAPDQDLAGLLRQHADAVDNYPSYLRGAQLIASLTASVESINSLLDTSTSALYAEYVRGAVYEDDGHGGWTLLSDVLVQGPLRPFIGDRLEVRPDGALLLVDSARGVAVAEFVHLQVRSKDDPAVGRYSEAADVGGVARLGHAGLDNGGRESVISRNRWEQEETDPPLEV